MAEPAESGATDEEFRCPRCGNMFPTEAVDEGDCTVCGTHCTRETCMVLHASNEDF